MKTLILFSLLFSSLGAKASYFQNYCGNAEGTVRVADGHDENYFMLTERVWGDHGVSEKQIKYIDYELSEKSSKSIEIENSFENSCKDGDETGYGSWKVVTSKVVTVYKVDGSLFSEDIVGVSEDRKTVSAYVICEENGSSMVLCEDN